MAPDEIKIECEEKEMDINETQKRDTLDKDIPDKDEKGLDELLDKTQKKDETHDETLVEDPTERQTHYSGIGEDENGNHVGIKVWRSLIIFCVW